jgi:hypothetical protein
MILKVRICHAARLIRQHRRNGELRFDRGTRRRFPLK